MTFRFSKGDYAAQIFAYELDPIRLLQHVQLYIAAGNAIHGAVFLCRYSGQPSSIEKSAITAESSTPGPRIGYIAPKATAHRNTLSGELTLTLIHYNNTRWRFDDFNNRLASPKLTWPDVYKFFTPGSYVDVDLILKDQFLLSPSCFVPQIPAHLLHIQITCNTESDEVVRDIASKLRVDLAHWTRQLIFQVDPAQYHPKRNSEHVLVMEFDIRHTADTIASTIDTKTLRRVSENRAASSLIRILSLEGSATYHNATSQDPASLVVDKRTPGESFTTVKDMGPPETPYFGIPRSRYVHH